MKAFYNGYKRSGLARVHIERTLANAGRLLPPGGETRHQWIAGLEQAPRGTGLCDCDDPDPGGAPTNPSTGATMDHHCECRAVITAATLLGAYSSTVHAGQCGHGTELDEGYLPRQEVDHG